MPERSYSFFDFDNTLYKGQSRYLILDFAIYLEEMSCFDSAELKNIKSLFSSYDQGSINRHDFGVLVVESYYRGLSELEEKKIQDQAAFYWDNIYKDAWFPYTIPLLKIINTATTSILISGSPIEIIEIINNTLGFTEIYASKGVIQDGIYTGLTEKEMATCSAKSELMEVLSKTIAFDPATSFAFGDSESDYPLLESVSPKNAYLLGAITESRKPGKSFNWNFMEQEKEILMSVTSRINTLFK
jgi:HAD superfamily phosphoserine phosphatase-like hydrolase